MEFANGKIGGSVFSFGYLMTDEEFNILTPPADICINPDCEWNEYVAKNILAYPMETIEASPLFPECYENIRALFAEADIAVGFSVSNDVAGQRVKMSNNFGNLVTRFVTHLRNRNAMFAIAE